MPVVYDTPWADASDALGGLSLGLYMRLARWKRETALRRPPSPPASGSSPF